jgi:hypothetical protein
MILFYDYLYPKLDVYSPPVLKGFSTRSRDHLEPLLERAYLPICHASAYLEVTNR